MGQTLSEPVVEKVSLYLFTIASCPGSPCTMMSLVPLAENRGSAWLAPIVTHKDVLPILSPTA